MVFAVNIDLNSLYRRQWQQKYGSRQKNTLVQQNGVWQTHGMEMMT